MDCIKHSNRILLEDTDAVTTLWYAGFLLDNESQVNRTDALAEAIQYLLHNIITKKEFTLAKKQKVESLMADTKVCEVNKRTIKTIDLSIASSR